MNLPHDLLKGATDIAYDLLKQRQQDQHGIYWLSSPVSNGEIAENICSGNAGITLFFIELYKQTEEELYWDVAEQSMAWLLWYCEQNTTDNYSFFTGRMGIVYALNQLYELTEEETYLYKALAIAQKSTQFLQTTTANDTLSSGTAGTLLALLHLHQTTHEESLLPIIDQFIGHLIAHAQIGPMGLYWNKSHDNIRGLCGLAQGAAGIGFVFLELGFYFQNEAFYWIAEQAFAYENYFYNNTLNNYPDFSKKIKDSKTYQLHKEKYLAGDWDFFTESKDSNNWSHGAAGIGLSRLRAYELLYNPQYLKDVQNCLDKTIETDLNNLSKKEQIPFSLCSSAGGNTDLFIEAYRVLKNEKHLNIAHKIATQIFDNQIEIPKKESLLMGKAGMGYFYLRLHNPLITSSILAPKLSVEAPLVTDANHYPNISILQPELERTVIQKSFPLTFDLLANVEPDNLINFLIEEHQQPTHSFIQLIEQITPEAPLTTQARIKDIFQIENTKLQVAQNIRSNALLHIQEVVHSEQVKDLLNRKNGSSFLQQFLKLADDVTILNAQWDWQATRKVADNLQIAAKDHPILFKPMAANLVEMPLNAFNYSILDAFRNANTTQNALKKIQSYFSNKALDNTTQHASKSDEIYQNAIEQIKHFLELGILVIV